MKEYEIFSGRLECPHKVLQLEYTPDGKQIVAIMKSVEQMKNGKKERPKYKTCNWDARTRNMISIKEYGSKPIINHLGTVLHRSNAVALDDSGQFVAILSLSLRDCSIHILDIDSERCISKIRLEEIPCSVTFSPNADFILTSYNHPFKGISLWRVSDKLRINTLHGFNHLFFEEGVFSVEEEERIARLYNSQMQGVMSDDSDIGYFPGIEEADKVDEIFLPGRYLHPSFSYNGKFVISAAEDGAIRVWNVNTGNIHLMISGQHFTYARFSPNDDSIVATSEHAICIYDSSTGALIKKYEDQSMHFTCSVFSPDYSQIAAGTEEGNICAWESPSLNYEFIN